MKLYMDRRKDLHMVVIDLEKAYDRVPYEVLWECLGKKEVAMTYIQVIKNICKLVLGPQLGTQSTFLLTLDSIKD